MKKSGIALLLTLSLTLCTVLGCFVIPASAEGESSSVASIVDVNASVVGVELQVVINATDAKSYKLYENGTNVAESEYPIIVYAKYDATKAYGVSALDENGNETAITNIVDIAKPEAGSYNASNLLAQKPFEMANYAKQWAHAADSVKNWNNMTDGNMTTRYSVTNVIQSVIDGVVALGATYNLGELRFYDYDGTGGARTCGTRLIVEVYTEGRWLEVANYDLADMQANYSVERGEKVGYFTVDLFGYRGEAIRIYNDGMTVANDCLGYWEITLSGVLASTDSFYNVIKDTVEENDNALVGMEFKLSENASINFLSGGTTDRDSVNNHLKKVTDGDVASFIKFNGSRLEFELDYESEYTYINEITVTYNQNTAKDGSGYYNRHYQTGSDVVISVYFDGVWREVYSETFADNVGTRTFDLGGVLAEKIRYYCSNSAVYFYRYDTEGNAYDANGNPVTADGTHTKASEAALGIKEITAKAVKFNIKDELENELVETENVFLGETFYAGANSGKVWGGSYANLSDNSTGTVVKTNDRAEAYLDFNSVARLDSLTVKYSSGLPRRCGSGIIIEITYAGKTYTVVNHTYGDATATATFDLGGCLAESVRIYVPGLHPATKVDENTTDNCIEICEIYCTGAKKASIHTNESLDNILAGVPMTKGLAGTAVHAPDYDYHTLTDGSFDSKTGRFSTVTASGVVMDANASLDSSLGLGELRIYDFEPDANTRIGNHLQIMLLINGSWKTVYDLYGSDIYANRGTSSKGKYVSYDLRGIHASQIRIIARQTAQSISVTIYEIELSAIDWDYTSNDGTQGAQYDGSNVLLGIPEENVKITANGGTVSMNPNHPLRYAFDGIVDPDLIDGKGTTNRYATQGSMTPIKDDNGNQIGAYYTLEIDLKNDTQLNVLSVYEWRSGTATTRSNKTTVEVKINGGWVKMFRDVSLSNDKAVDRTDFDLGGVVASAIRITFLNDYYEGSVTATGLWPTPTIKEITCTGTLSVGDLFDAFESIDLSTDGTPVFGLEQVKDQKLEELKAQLVAISGASSEEIIEKINEFKQIAAEFESGVTPVTDEYGDFTSANISLAGNVGFNFYGSLDENVEELFPNATVVVRYNSVLDGVATDNTEQRQLSELKKDGNGRYIVDFELAAAQMTDTVEIRLVLDGNNCGEHITWSIKDYCDKLVSETADEGLKSVVNAMLTYGAYAQTYFGYNTDKLAADASGELESVTETAKPAVNGSATGVSMSSWTLALDSNVTAKLYVRLDGVAAEDIGVTITTPSGEVINVDSLEAVGSRYRISVTDITSGFLNDIYTVTITNKADGSVMTVESSAMCYVSAVLAMENADPALVNLVTALKLYSNAADSYFGK